ncbi:type I restriction enzyme HsdR N-terminal domain-containing protein [Microbacter margulisiae]|uniref:Type I restriction enzyme R protein N-terminal domain-containing protein n=1 Tax=Microbacter margulisiae TaxID=1350067 RepID=A0A7W5DNE6_9PORP|nr:type I restriction enzyme HsdR N-terminal domain-containing protein [Microbacter margulisiae]MBB3186056.1 hypothetical protein [Microbacter margulisiae]
MIELNLPVYSFQIKNRQGKPVIFDRLRKRFVALTPEEWVRQNVVEYLISEKSYPSALMANEISLQQNGVKKRCDTIVYNREGNPLLIAEFKAPEIEITQQTFDQIARYNIMLKVSYLLISNGLKHFCCQVDYERQHVSFLPDIPFFTAISGK